MCMKKITCEDYQDMCIKNGLFTCGTINQYMKVEGMIGNNCSKEELVLVTWLCSDDKFSYKEIQGILSRYFKG